MKLTEKDLEYIIRESAKSIVLTEGIASKELQRQAKIHGGINNGRHYMDIDRIPLDKWQGNTDTKIWCFPNPYIIKFKKYTSKEFKTNPEAQKEFQAAYEVGELLKMNKLKHLASFNDGYDAYISNSNDPEIQKELANLENALNDLQGRRLSDYANGKKFYNDEYREFRTGDGDIDWRSTGNLDYNSPRDAKQYDRLKAHVGQRGKTKELGRGSDVDYNAYVSKYAQQVADKYGMKKYDWGVGFEGMLTPQEQEMALKDFGKIGYKRDDSHSSWGTNSNEPVRFGVCPRGKRYMEWDDPAFGPDGYVQGKPTPKIGYSK